MLLGSMLRLPAWAEPEPSSQLITAVPSLSVILPVPLEDGCAIRLSHYGAGGIVIQLTKPEVLDFVTKLMDTVDQPDPPPPLQ